MKPDRPYCNLAGDYSVERPRLSVADGGRLVKLSFSLSRAAEWNGELFSQRGGVRGRCKGFSFGSRRRMLDRLNSVSVNSPLPYFVTMTLPDDVFCDQVGEFAKLAKQWLDTFEKRLLRVSPAATGFWRIEWKARETGRHQGKLFPHFHLLVWGLQERELRDSRRDDVREAYVACPDDQLTLNLLDLWDQRSRGLVDWKWQRKTSRYLFAGSRKFVDRCDWLSDQVHVPELNSDRGRNMALQDWASLAWYHIVDSGNLDHLTAGVRVEQVRSWGGVMTYASKYMSKADAEFMADISWGRCWGIFNRRCMPWATFIQLNLDNEVGVRLRRVARRYLERRLHRRIRAPYGLTLYCDPAQWRRLWDSPARDPF